MASVEGWRPLTVTTVICCNSQFPHFCNRGYNPSTSVEKLLEGTERTTGAGKKVVGGAK